MSIVISGCGRSGTKAMSDFLISSGVEVGHERVFNGVELLRKTPCSEFINSELREGLVGDSSWMAVPFLDLFSANTKLIYMLRDPLKVIKSFYEFGAMKFPSYSPSIRFAQSLLPEMCSDDELYNAIAYCIKWNDMAFDKLLSFDRDVIFFDIENSHVSKIEDFLGVQVNSCIKPRNSRSCEKVKNISVDEVLSRVISDSYFRNSYYRIESMRKSNC